MSDFTAFRRFVQESNGIEGIVRPPTDEEIRAHKDFLSSDASVSDLERLVEVCAPGHALRDRVGLNVRVGEHIAPAGGPEIRERVELLLSLKDEVTPHTLHCRYEDLHPFTDGNGRSGRALWLWMMARDPRNARMAESLGFLHSFYYQTLEASEHRRPMTPRPTHQPDGV